MSRRDYGYTKGREGVSLIFTGYTRTVDSVHPERLVGQAIDERYELEELLHSGAHVWVYRAHRQPATASVGGESQERGVVALKVLHNPRPVALDRFERELQALVALPRLDHVVGLIDQGRTKDGKAYIALELVDGLTLHRGMARHHTLEPRKAAALVAEISNAVAELHQRGIVHQQLIPANILIDRRRGIKLTDLGLIRDTRHVLEGLQQTTIFDRQEFKRELSRYLPPDNFEMMAPEQLGEITGVFVGDVTARSDVYCLGALLFQLLTGELPTTMREAFSVEGAWKELIRYGAWRAQLEDQPYLNRGGLDPELAAILAQAMHRHPIERYRDARELGAALINYLRREESRTTPRTQRVAHQTEQQAPLVSFAELFFPEDAQQPLNPLSISASPEDSQDPLSLSDALEVVPPQAMSRDEEASIEVDYNLSTTELMEALNVDSLSEYRTLLDDELDPTEQRTSSVEIEIDVELEDEADQKEPEPSVIVTRPVMITPPPVSLGNEAAKDTSSHNDSDRATTREIDLSAETRVVDVDTHLPEEVAEIYRQRHKRKNS